MHTIMHHHLWFKLIKMKYNVNLFCHEMEPLVSALVSHNAKSLSVAPLQALDQYNKNEIQYDYVGYVTPLALASCDADGVIYTQLHV